MNAPASSGSRGKPRVVPIVDIPEADAGAPMPVVLADDDSVAIAFYASNRWISSHRPDWTRCVVGVHFDGVNIQSFGAPNDEASSGHPLAKYGLTPYGFARVEGSPLIEWLRLMNSVHPYHRDEAFAALLHVVMPFHDNTFECVASTYTVTITEDPDDTPLAMVVRLVS